MHACREAREIAGEPVSNDPTKPAEDSELSNRWFNQASWFFVGLGLLLRLGAYLLHFPLWWDEAFVAVNFLRRDYLDLIRPLDYGQVCPLLFLWAELASVKMLGFSEWSLRLFPLVCSLMSVVVFRSLTACIFRGRALLLVVGVFAVSVHPIRHAADVKPYASDLLAALILIWLAVSWMRAKGDYFRIMTLAAFVPVALLVSHPATFIVVGIGLAIVIPAWQTRLVQVRLGLVAYGMVSFVSYALIYVLFTKPQASATSPGMREMWIHSFPPLNSSIGFVKWFLVVHSGDMLAYPCGGERGGSVLSLLLCATGFVSLVRSKQYLLLGILLMPLLPALMAAGLQLYPYGGPAPHGSSARIMQYCAPSLCLLIGLGASRLTESVPSLRLKDRFVKSVCVLLILIGLVTVLAGWSHPYRAYQAQSAREFARSFWPKVCEGAEVSCLRWDENVAEWDSIRLGIAVSLCNEAIYAPNRKLGGPDYTRISSTHPLRCVLGVAPEVDSPRVIKWLVGMLRTYELRRRQTFLVDTAEPGRGALPERYEVFEFVPRSGPHSVERNMDESVAQ